MSERILLHSCCAPCSSAILEWLLNNGYAPVVFFFNPNIFPQEEYVVRKNEIARYCKDLDVPFIDGDWDHALWREAVRGLENEPERGRRCLKCFTVRLTAAAKKASELGIETFTTTLASSRWKSLEQVKEAGDCAASLYPGTHYWDRNWRKGGLQDRRCQIIRERHFYNQLWCGCEFSMGHLLDRDPSELPPYVLPWLKKIPAKKKAAEAAPEGEPASGAPAQDAAAGSAGASAK